ncbi:choline/carnitine/betaine transport [Agrococcus baldri]|uniref:Choline/carnitine/betaine transport n=1 Tax=Agrococcus baldri TaxID=153730 RepID=A0AA94HKC6_9MICO|nr:BCCT family transporter [Agrococcus baldri]SFR99649.1 choline/carnitine/betaine transport [Agrococcus baldri]
MSESTPATPPRKPRTPVKQVVREVTEPGLVHPALIPGIGVERTGKEFATNWAVFAIAGAFVAAVIIWGIVDPDSIQAVGSASLGWVTVNFGWMFGALTIAITIFMLFVGYGRTGGVRLGMDDEEPEFSTVSWVAMLFSAGLGIGLLFYGPMEPLTYFVDLPPGFRVEDGTVDAMHAALAQTLLHWGPMAWAYYALVGGAIAYAAYRRGRSPLISAIFTPIFGQKTEGWLGSIIDIFAIVVTLGGTAISLGIGALQISRGFEIITGIGEVGNGFIIGAIAVLTAMFVVSAVSGIKRGIRALSNINMIIAGVLGLFVFVAGPTLLVLNLLPSVVVSFFSELGTMLARSGSQGEETQAFLSAWTTYYWAWWVSWTPFVGMFIAKISRGRTLREFVTVVIIVPSIICLVWFTVLGGTSMAMEMDGLGISGSGSAEAILFTVLGNLPLGIITSVLALISITIFFVTSADSASIVMGSMSQRGKPEPSMWVTITWGVLLGATAATLLVAGGETALGGLQSLMVVTALPFAIVVIGIMFAWAKELRTDPYMLRRKYAKAAIAQGVRLGIEEHGDDFVFGSSEVVADDGAGAWLDTEDPSLTEWWTDATTGTIHAADVTRNLDPGRIQRKGPDRPDHTASGDNALTVGEERMERLRRERQARRHPEQAGAGEPGAGEPEGGEPEGDEPRP